MVGIVLLHTNIQGPAKFHFSSMISNLNMTTYILPHNDDANL